MTAPPCPYEGKPGILIDHVEGLLPDHEEGLFRAHLLAGCPRCTADIRSFTDILALARGGPEPTPATGAETRIRAGIRRRLAEPERPGLRWGSWWRPVALAGAIATVAVVLVLTRGGGDGKAPDIRAADVASDPVLEREIGSYERDRIEEFGTGVALENLSDGEQAEMTRLLDEELDALLAKHRAGEEQSAYHSGPEVLPS